MTTLKFYNFLELRKYYTYDYGFIIAKEYKLKSGKRCKGGAQEGLQIWSSWFCSLHGVMES